MIINLNQKLTFPSSLNTSGALFKSSEYKNIYIKNPIVLPTKFPNKVYNI